MKKNLLWMFAAILSSGLAFTACTTEDNPSGAAELPGPKVVNFEDEDASSFVIAEASRMSVAVIDDETESNGTKVAQFTRGGSSGFGFAAYTLEGFENAISARVSFDFNIPAEILGQSAISLGDASVHNAATGGFNTTSGQYGYGTNGCIFYMGAYRGKAYGGGNENYFQINGAPAAASREEHPAADVWGRWLHADLDVDVENQLVSYNITADGETWWAAEDVPFVSEAALALTQISLYVGYSGSYLIDNVKVEKMDYDPTIQYADYSIVFVDTDGNAVPEDLKKPVTRRGRVGDAIELLASDKADAQTADGATKYIYDSDTAEGSTISAEGTVVKVIFKKEEVAKYKYLLNVYAGEGTSDRVFFETGEEFEGVKKTFYLPTVVKGSDGAYYSITPKQYNGYDVTFTGNEAKTAGYCLITVNYTKNESIVYFGDCEDLAQEGNFGTPFSQGTFNRFSQGKAAQPQAGATITTEVIAAGTYNVVLYGRCDGGSGDENDVLYVQDASGNLTKVASAPDPATWASANMGEIKFADVTIPQGGKLVIKNDTAGEKNSYDCIKVLKAE